MIIKKQLVKRQVAGDCFLVPVGKTVYDSNGIFVLTPVGAFIWDLIPDAENKEDILEKITQEYDVDRETAEADLDIFLQKLRDMDII